ncbi:MAG: hypothetical protein IKZ75_04725 [Oscillospiraceae bacterium]|nr:hypothetical protein [Oscillospiraceae bacterium]
MIKNKYVAFVVFVVLFLVIWNALQYFMGHFENGYSVSDNIVFPLTVAVVCAYITYFRPGNKFDQIEQQQQEEKKDNE